MTEGGRPKCTITAGHLLRYKDRSELEGVRATFYDRRGRASIELTAERGVVYGDEERVEVEGDVVLVYGDSLKVEAERARWEREEGRIVAEGPVRIWTQEGEEIGEGFVCDARSGRWWMRSVRGQVLAR